MRSRLELTYTNRTAVVGQVGKWALLGTHLNIWNHRCNIVHLTPIVCSIEIFTSIQGADQLAEAIHAPSHASVTYPNLLCHIDPPRRSLLKYLGAEHANRVCFLIRKILTFTFILLHSLLTYFSSRTPHFRYLRSISSLHSYLYLHRLSLL